MPGAADVPDDLLQRRRRGDRRELPGDRPAGLAADDSQLSPQRPLVDLDDDAVDLVVELLAALLPPQAALDDLVLGLVDSDLRLDREAVVAQPVELLRVGLHLDPAAGSDPVGPEPQGPLGGDLRVELADRPGSGVARVRKGGLARRRPALVQLLEAAAREVDLAADLDQLGVGVDPQRDRAHRPQVVADVLADPPVAAGGAADEAAVLVYERDREPIDLRLGYVAELVGGDV